MLKYAKIYVAYISNLRNKTPVNHIGLGHPGLKLYFHWHARKIIIRASIRKGGKFFILLVGESKQITRKVNN